MYQPFLHEFSGRSLGVVVGMMAGSAVTAWIARRRLRKERLRVLQGDARDTIVIHQHILQKISDPQGHVRHVMRIRTLGQSELRMVVPNGHLAAILAKRAAEVTPSSTLISMDGPEGSYLLETMTNFVCDRVANREFPHDTYVMTACCEPAELSHHQPITILLLKTTDLELFADWKTAREIRVEHGSDGARILSLCDMVQKFRQEQAKIEKLRADGRRTAFMETMYLLDLALDMNCASIPSKPVPWDRYAGLLSREVAEVRNATSSGQGIHQSSVS